jgi:hypothetical protein
MAESPLIPEHERAGYTSPEFLARVAPLDPLAWLPLLDKRPFRLQENLFNRASPETVRKQFETSAAGKAVIVRYQDLREYGERVSADGRMLNWLEAQLASSGQ